ncbi:hypothetical protein [Nesterenkonia rhizosphaerae]
MRRTLATAAAVAIVVTSVLTGVPFNSAQPAHANTGSISLSHELRTPEAREANRLLTNSTVRLIASAQIDRASSSSAVEFKIPKGLQVQDIPAHCGPDSSLNNRGDQPSRNTPITATSWESLREQVLVCDLGSTGAGYTNASVWIDAKVRPELPPGHRFTVQAQTIADEVPVASTSYTRLPAVFSQARIALGPHSELHEGHSWPGVNYRTAWPALEGTENRHPHPETEMVRYWRLTDPFILTTPSQYGNQPLDWSRSEISFDWKPDEVYFPGVTRTKPWVDRQRSHGDAYTYYMPHLFLSNTRPISNHTLNTSSGNPDEAFLGNSADLTFTADPRTQKIVLDGTNIETSAWTVPTRTGFGSNGLLPHKDPDYDGPDYEMLWSRNIEVFVPGQALADLIPFSPRANRLPVTVSQPTLRAVGVHETNRPWRSAPKWSETGLGRDDGYVEVRQAITSPWKASPLNTPGPIFSPGFNSWWEGLPGSSKFGDGEGQLMPGATAMWAAGNRLTAPVGGAVAQFQCVSWEDHLSLVDPKTKYHPGSGSALQNRRHPATGPVYISGAQRDLDFSDLRFEVQYSNTKPAAGDDLTCDSGNWRSNPNHSSFNNDPAKAREGIYTGVKQIRFMIAADQPTRWDLITQIPLTPTNDRYRGQAWVWTSQASLNFNTQAFDSLSEANLAQFFRSPEYRRTATITREPRSHVAEKLTIVDPLSMVEVESQAAVAGGALGEVTVKPHSPSSRGPMEVRVEFDRETMLYHDTTAGPQPHQVGRNFVVYRLADPTAVDEIVLRMLTTPREASTIGTIETSSRMPKEGSRRNNNASTTMRIDSSTPMIATLRAANETAEVHPFRSPAQTNHWTMTFGNETAFHSAAITAYVLIPRAGMTSNVLSHRDANVMLGNLNAAGWTVEATTQAFNRNSTLAQLSSARYTSVPNDPSRVQAIRLTRTISPGQTREVRIPMGVIATTDGDQITPHLIYNVDLVVQNETVTSFTGRSSPQPMEVSSGSAAGEIWIDGTRDNHDGTRGKKPAVRNAPVRITGTTASGLDISESIHVPRAVTNAQGKWTIQNLPAGTYNVEPDVEWLTSRAHNGLGVFDGFTLRGGDSVFGYTSRQGKADFENQVTSHRVSIPALGRDGRHRTSIGAGLVGHAQVQVERSTVVPHHYGYREMTYPQRITIRNTSAFNLSDVNITDLLDGPAELIDVSTPSTGSVRKTAKGYTWSGNLNTGRSFTINATWKVNANARANADLRNNVSATAAWAGGAADSQLTHPMWEGTVGVPALDAKIDFTDSGSWLENDENTLIWHRGQPTAADDPVMVERVDGRFGPAESLTSHVTLTNNGNVPLRLPSRATEVTFAGTQGDREQTFGAQTLMPGERVTIDARDLVPQMPQEEVDLNQAVLEVSTQALAPTRLNSSGAPVFTSGTLSLHQELKTPTNWSRDVPFRRAPKAQLTAFAEDASGNGILEDGEDAIFTYTIINDGNITVSGAHGDEPSVVDALVDPVYESDFNGKLLPGEKVTVQTRGPITEFTGGKFVNQAEAEVSLPLSSDRFGADSRLRASTTVVAPGGHGLDLIKELIPESGRDHLARGEKFHWRFTLTNNSDETYHQVQLQDPAMESAYGVTPRFSLPSEQPLNPGDRISVDVKHSSFTAGNPATNGGVIRNEARVTARDFSGERAVSNIAVAETQVYGEPLIIAAGHAGPQASAPLEAVRSGSWWVWTIFGVLLALSIGAGSLALLGGAARRRMETTP